MANSSQFQVVMPLTRVVKILIIANVSLWVTLVLIVQNYFMDRSYIFLWFGLVPLKFLTEFWIWQPVTYMFLHSSNVFHVLFNMLTLWWLGADLEQRWGSRFFLIYYLVSGVGAALIYLVGMVLYYLLSQSGGVLLQPVVGASGAVFGLLVAYGILFGERIVYFMMTFPMKAKYFVLILGGVEILTLLSSGVAGQVANLAHLGGAVAGFLFLFFYGRWQRLRQKGRFGRNGRRLKLVVDNERSAPDSERRGPRYWN